MLNNIKYFLNKKYFNLPNWIWIIICISIILSIVLSLIIVLNKKNEDDEEFFDEIIENFFNNKNELKLRNMFENENIKNIVTKKGVLIKDFKNDLLKHKKTIFNNKNIFLENYISILEQLEYIDINKENEEKIKIKNRYNI